MTGIDEHPWQYPSTDWSAPQLYGPGAAAYDVGTVDPPTSVRLGTPGRIFFYDLWC